MYRRLRSLPSRVKTVLQEEGLIPLITKGFAFLQGYFFQYSTFYLYEYTMKERNETDFMPRLQNFTFQIVSTNEQADELAANGIELSSLLIDARRHLDRGAVAFCILVGREIAHMGWVAMTEEAKNSLTPYPFEVDFSNRQAFTGGTVTLPKYRGKGLMAYGYYKRLQFLRERGITTSRNVVSTSNLISQRVHAKFNPKIYAKARYLKILGWQSWRETPIAPNIGDN